MRLTKKSVLLAVAAAAGALLVLAPVASADYGGGAAKNTWQIEVSVNCDNRALCGDIQGGTGGFWVWGEFDQAGTGYTGDAEITGCFHSSDFSGAQHTSEDISSWQVGANGNFQITGGTDTDLFRGTKVTHPIWGDNQPDPNNPTIPASPTNPSDTGIPAIAGTYHLNTFDVFGFSAPGVSAQITVAYRPAR
jgi:hypothetical protein